MLEYLQFSLNSAPAARRVASGANWLVGASPAAGLVTRISSVIGCARDKTVNLACAVRTTKMDSCAQRTLQLDSCPSLPSKGVVGGGNHEIGKSFRPLSSVLWNRLVRVAHATVLCLLSSVLWAATPPNTAITNTARATYDVNGATIIASGAVTVTTATAAQTPALIEFLRYAPGVGVATVVQPTISNGTTLPPPVVGNTTLAVGSALPLAHATTYASGEPVFIKVTDYDRNQNPSQLDTLSIVIRTLEGGEFENLVLTETGPNTGVFVGYVQSKLGEAPASSTQRFIGFAQAPLSPAAINNGTLNTYSNAQLSVTYQDGVNGNTSIAAAALIDPFGVLFDSATGAPVDGVRIRFVDAATGLDGIVFGNDGVSRFPSTITTGGTATDASGLVYNFAPGAYQFPLAAAGTYRLEVIPPIGFSFPSTISNATLQTLPGAPYALVVGSRGEDFPLVDGPPLRIDIPLDSANGSLQITKSASKAVVSVGDFVPYILSIRNPNPLDTAAAVQIVDRLPVGFRYQANTARLNDVALANPAIAADGRTLTFNLGVLAAGVTVNVKYVAAVVAGAQAGPAENTAQALGIVSNTARATVLVREDLNHSRAILMGRVIVGSCDDGVENDAIGLANVRIVLQDGTYIRTDKEGRWHADNIRPGTHVVQLDLDSLPEGYEVVACEDNARFAGRNYSQFVNVRGGSLWRADFYVQKTVVPVEPVIAPVVPPAPVIELPPVCLAEPTAEIAMPTKFTISSDKTFEFNKALLRDEGKAELDNFADKVKPLSFTTIRITGHTDKLGSAQYNKALSLKRSNAVKAYLVSKGIRPEQIETVGGGKDFPITTPSLCALLSGKARIKCLAPDRRVAVDVLGLAQTLASVPQIFNCISPAEHAQRLAALTLAAQNNATQNTTPPVLTPTASITTDATVAEADAKAGDAGAGEKLGEQQGTQLVEKLPYDEKWLATASLDTEWLHPQESFQPALPVIKIAVKHSPSQRVEIKVNGEKVSALNYDGKINNTAATVALSSWRGVPIKEGANHIEMTVLDAQGGVVKLEQRNIHYGGGAVKAVFDAARSVLVADGKTRPVIAVRLLDKDGKPVRRGVSGEFQLNAPYIVQSKLDGIEQQPLNGGSANSLVGHNQFNVADDGVALITLQPTTQTGEVVLGFDIGAALNRGAGASLGAEVKKDRQEIRAWLAPGEREWILVGFAEGTVGHKQLNGNMESLKSAQAEDKLFDENRIAFYAKGTVKGEYLLTAAYDTAKEQGQGGARNLKQMVDPNQYYTLYADATTAQFDAASARKLYLKIEKKQFYAMFGDYDTGLTVTELGRYSRTLNGFKSEFKGETIKYNAFATLTAQSYKKDEIQGDGTSGLYRLSSRNIVLNSDKVSIEIRDRFQSQIIISRRALTRFLDYDLDPALGTVFFREPIVPRDPDFNPVFIVVEYEAEDKSDEKMSYGGRVAQTTERAEIGVTHIKEGNIGKTARLTALDTTVKMGEQAKLRAEIARSDRDVNDITASGRAWLVEAWHEGERVAAKAYVREAESGFGLGQQAAAEAGMRKAGTDVRFKISDQWQMQGAATRQENMATHASRDTLEAQAQWHKENLSLNGGLRTAQDKDQLGLARESNQALAGAAYTLLDKRLTLSANTEIDIGSQADTAASAAFPNRLNLGADYKITQQTSMFAKQEFARGNVSADTTSVGLRTQPWTGSEASTSLGKQTQQSETMDSNRVFANMGLVQKLQLNEHWQADLGADRSQTLSQTGTNPLNTNQPLASGTPIAAAPGIVTGDYTAVHTGAGYHDKIWSGNGRVEWRTSDTDEKVNVLFGAQRILDAGRSVAAGLSASKTNGIARDDTKLGLRLSYAYRPNDSRWVWLDRLDYVQEISRQKSGVSASIVSADNTFHARKLVNNLNANYMPNRRTQLAMQYGSKYVLDSIDGMDFTGYTDLVGFEVRHDLHKRWDIGASTSMLHSWKADTRDYQLGASIGYRVMDNAWLSLGYNRLGFVDGNFAGAEYRVQGAYLNIRIKVDQDTFKLNDKADENKFGENKSGENKSQITFTQ